LGEDVVSQINREMVLLSKLQNWNVKTCVRELDKAFKGEEI
jgi:hypothetical protein